jgi:hypothetical protein
VRAAAAAASYRGLDAADVHLILPSQWYGTADLFLSL